jgi:hypothetical protein
MHAAGVTEPSHVEGGVSAVQFTHAVPWPPHCVSRKPGWHTCCASQQPAQLIELQALMHWPLVHVSPTVVQSWHCAPPKPHALGVSPKTHVLPWQHPPQFCGPHSVAATHAWFWQVSPCWVQFWHAMPACPHAESTSPATHALFWQHPAQVFGLHPLVETQAWFEHVSPVEAQSTHVAPPEPQVTFSEPSMHVLPTQHPLQFCGLQVGWAMHCWLVHVSPNPWQFWHVTPPNPHAKGEVPTRHELP